MLKKENKYTYEEIEKVFDEIKLDVVMNPYGDEKGKENELSGDNKIISSFMAIVIFHTIEQKFLNEIKKR